MNKFHSVSILMISAALFVAPCCYERSGPTDTAPNNFGTDDSAPARRTPNTDTTDTADETPNTDTTDTADKTPNTDTPETADTLTSTDSAIANDTALTTELTTDTIKAADTSNTNDTLLPLDSSVTDDTATPTIDTPETETSTDSALSVDTEMACTDSYNCDGDDAYSVDDCDDYDASRHLAEDGYVYPDADSDGFADSNEYTLLCVGDTPKPGTLFSPLGRWDVVVDCDPGDAQHSQFYCRDEDGDKYCATIDESQFLCPGNRAPDGWTPVTENWQFREVDCNDGNAAIQVVGYPDMDRDGAAATEGLCISTAELDTPTSIFYSAYEGNDCDDNDPMISPYRPDVMDNSPDNIPDNNCDNLVETDLCPLSWVMDCPAALPQSSCSPGEIDLAVTGSDLIISCAHPPIGGIVLANIGDVAYSGTIRITYLEPSILERFFPFIIDGLETMDVNVSLAAGDQVYVSTNASTSGVEVLLLDGEDCDLTNNQSEYATTSATCE